jgi:hypothetical protein
LSVHLLILITLDSIVSIIVSIYAPNRSGVHKYLSEDMAAGGQSPPQPRNTRTPAEAQRRAEEQRAHGLRHGRQCLEVGVDFSLRLIRTEKLRELNG